VDSVVMPITNHDPLIHISKRLDEIHQDVKLGTFAALIVFWVGLTVGVVGSWIWRILF
jgi:hypothetical protein